MASTDTINKRVGFIGAGQMATALARGMVAAGLVDAGSVRASDPSATARKRLAAAVGGDVLTTDSNAEVVQESDVLVLAVKPHLMQGVCATLADGLRGDQLVVTVAAGIRVKSYLGWLGAKVRLVRVMPNTPCMVGSGACGYCLGGAADQADAELVDRLLSAVGRALRVEERLLDAVTGLSGSGPALIFIMIEELADGGVRAGLPRDAALMLAAQTVFGAADMVLQTGEHPGVLKDRVASPGGTTIAGIETLELHGVRGALIDAVRAAAERSIELSAK